MREGTAGIQGARHESIGRIVVDTAEGGGLFNDSGIGGELISTES